MTNLILTLTQAHHFWSAVQGRSPHVDGDVVEVSSKCSGDLYLRLAAQMWREDVAAWPLAIDGRVEAVVLARSQEEPMSKKVTNLTIERLCSRARGKPNSLLKIS